MASKQVKAGLIDEKELVVNAEIKLIKTHLSDSANLPSIYKVARRSLSLALLAYSQIGILSGRGAVEPSEALAVRDHPAGGGCGAAAAAAGGAGGARPPHAADPPLAAPLRRGRGGDPGGSQEAARHSGETDASKFGNMGCVTMQLFLKPRNHASDRTDAAHDGIIRRWPFSPPMNFFIQIL